MALQSLRSLQFSPSAATTIANYLDSHNFSKTPTCSCTTYNCTDMNAPRSQIINNNNKKFQFHLDIGGQTRAAPVSTITIGMNGTRYIRPTDLQNTDTRCTCHSDMDETINILDVRINSRGNVHSIDSKTLGDNDSCGTGCSATQLSALSCGTTCATPTKTDFNFNNMTLDGVNFSGRDLSGAHFDNAKIKGCDFSGADLTNADFSNASVRDSHFSGAHLSGAHFENTEIEGCDFSGADLTGSTIKRMGLAYAMAEPTNFYGANFSGSHLNFFAEGWLDGAMSGWNFDEAKFIGATFNGEIQGAITGGSFKNADFSGVQGLVFNPWHDGINLTSANLSNITFHLDTDDPPARVVADNANFQHSVIRGGLDFWDGLHHSMKNADFTNADLTGFIFMQKEEEEEQSTCDLSGANFTGATVKGVGFYQVNLTNATFTDASASGADFTGATLTQANFTHADLSGAQFLGADASGAADFTGATLTHANFTGATLKYADFSGAHLNQANFTGAILTHADFTHADLSGAILSGALLYGAILSGAHLNGADLSGATLIDADLSGADLSGADLTNATLLGATNGHSANITGVTWKNTTCPDGSNSNSNSDKTCDKNLDPASY